jgi:Na+/proline symporter
MPPPPTMYTQQQYIPPMPPKQYGPNIPLIILSILNIITGWCCGIGTILGIIALIQAIDRKDAKNDEEARKATLLSLLFNGIALFVLLLAIIVPIMKFGSLVGGYEQLMQMFA